MKTQENREPDDEQIAWALHRLGVAWAADDVQLAQTLNVTSGDYQALKHVAVTDGIGPAELSRRLGMSTGAVNALINRMVAAGHLRRQRNPYDARRLNLRLDDGTRNLIASHYQARAEHALGATSHTADQRAVILRFLSNQAWFTPLTEAGRSDLEQVGAMGSAGLLPLIFEGRIDEAVSLAHEHSVDWVTTQLDYDWLDEHADQASEFLQAWCAALDPLARLQAADWAAGQYLTALVHLDHAYGMAAVLVLEAQRAVAARLASSLRDSWVLADGPDAELDESVVARLTGYADALDSMDFRPA